MGPTTLLLEARAAQHWQIGRAAPHLRYHEPPSLERDDQVVPGDRDVLGGRARMEWRVARLTVVHGNAMYYRFSTNDAPALEGGDASHLFGGLERRFGTRGNAALGGGWRMERKSDGEIGGGLWHVDMDVALSLPGTWSLTGKWNHRSERTLRFAGLEPFAATFWRTAGAANGSFGRRANGRRVRAKAQGRKAAK